MFRVICDRCKLECEGTTYYTIDIYGHDVRSTDGTSVSTRTAAQNTSTSCSKIFGTERHYCETCKDEIEQFMDHAEEWRV